MESKEHTMQELAQEMQGKDHHTEASRVGGGRRRRLLRWTADGGGGRRPEWAEDK